MDKQFNLYASLQKQIGEDEEFYYLEGIASSIGNYDRDNDKLDKTAFDETLASRNNVPLLLMHNARDKEAAIGGVTEIRKDGDKIRIKARLSKDDYDVMAIWPKVKSGAYANFSIGFRVMDAERISDADGGGVLIKRVDLYEVSLVTIPANPEAKVEMYKYYQSLIDEIDIKKEAETKISFDEWESMSVREREKSLNDGAPLSKSLSKKLSNMNLSSVEATEENDVEVVSYLKSTNKYLKELFNMKGH